MAITWLIRHAKAGTRGGSGGDDLARALSEKGEAQAEILATRLASKPIAAIYSSEAERCIATVTPLAKALGLSVQVEAGYTEGNPFTLPLDEINTVICAHGDNIPHLLASLGLDAWKCSKGSVWEIERDGEGQIVRAEYSDGPDS